MVSDEDTLCKERRSGTVMIVAVQTGLYICCTDRNKERIQQASELLRMICGFHLPGWLFME